MNSLISPFEQVLNNYRRWSSQKEVPLLGQEEADQLQPEFPKKL